MNFGHIDSGYGERIKNLLGVDGRAEIFKPSGKQLSEQAGALGEAF